jgi:hypothetical protein
MLILGDELPAVSVVSSPGFSLPGLPYPAESADFSAASAALISNNLNANLR